MGDRRYRRTCRCGACACRNSFVAIYNFRRDHGNLEVDAAARSVAATGLLADSTDSLQRPWVPSPVTHHHRTRSGRTRTSPTQASRGPELRCRLRPMARPRRFRRGPDSGSDQQEWPSRAAISAARSGGTTTSHPTVLPHAQGRRRSTGHSHGSQLVRGAEEAAPCHQSIGWLRRSVGAFEGARIARIERRRRAVVDASPSSSRRPPGPP